MTSSTIGAFKQYVLYTLVLLTAAQLNEAIRRSTENSTSYKVSAWSSAILVTIFGLIILFLFTGVPPDFEFNPVIASSIN